MLYTIGRVGAMDVNTDSNARQRDNCNVDAHITAMHQAATAPASSAAYRRRNAAFLFELDGAVHPWTEFKLFSLGAVHEYTLDTGDLTLAAQTFDELVRHYSLTQFVNATDGLVHKAPKAGLPKGMPTQAANNAEYYFQVWQDLVDYPNRPDALNDDDKFPEGANCCRDDYVDSNISTAINVHTAHAHRRLAQMSRWLGRPEAEAAEFDDKAAGIVRGLKQHLFVGANGTGATGATGAGAALSVACNPPAPACYADGMDEIGSPVNHTSVQASLFIAGCGLLPPTEALQLLPFLQAKTATMPLFSAMASNFVLEGLYYTHCTHYIIILTVLTILTALTILCSKVCTSWRVQKLAARPRQRTLRSSCSPEVAIDRGWK
jgi:hypothetical protein